MSTHSPNCAYLLVVDADQYSGNYERQLTGFCTGVDDGTHGDKEGADFRRWLDEHGKSVSWKKISTTCRDDKNYPRVCTIWPSPGRLNNGMGFHYDAGDEEAQANARLKAQRDMVAYQKPTVDRAQARLDAEDFEDASKPGAWTKEACERTIESSLRSISTAGDFVGFPAYESVAIFLTAKPSAADMAIFMERLADFSKDRMEFGRRTGKPLVVKRVYLAEKRGKEFVEIEEIGA
jgi:hypothetical protein